MTGLLKYILTFLIGISIMGNVFSQDKGTFKVGIIKYKTRYAVEQTYTPILNYLAFQLGKKAEITIYENGEDLGYLLSKGRLDMGIFTPFPYLSTKISFPQLEVFASHTVNGNNSYSGCILVHKESNIDALHKLQGKHFTFVKETSTSGYKYPKGIFKENNLDIDHNFFNEYVFSGGHKQSLESLINRETEGIAIDEISLQELSQEVKDQIISLAKYEVPYHAYILNPDLEIDLKDRIKETMFEAHLDPSIKRSFNNNPLGIRKWHPQTDEEYNPLRRYLNFVRVKPSLQFSLKLMESARTDLQGGDLVSIIEKNIINRLKKFNRFSQVVSTPVQNGKEAHLEIGLIGENYHSTLYLDEESLWETDFDKSQITDKEFADNIANSLMSKLPIKTQLLYNQGNSNWFVTYGTDDGIDQENYSFKLDGFEDELEVISLNNLTTVFEPEDEYQEGTEVYICYRMPEDSIFDFDSEDGNPNKQGFWSNLDNVWGVVGLIVAFLTLGIGSYFAGRKKKRFKNILYGANDILRLHIEGEENIQARLLKKKEKINRSLERGFINENQFLILMHRLDDIDYVISSYLVSKDALPEEVNKEIHQILSDGKITEREYSQLVSLIKTASLDKPK